MKSLFKFDIKHNDYSEVILETSRQQKVSKLLLLRQADRVNDKPKK